MLFGCGSKSTTSSLAQSTKKAAKSKSTKTSTTTKKKTSQVDAILKKMNLKEKLSQMMVIGMSGTSVSSSLKSDLKRNCYGGVIYFRNNMTSKNQVLTMSKALQSAALSSHAKVPMLIATDQEGGVVNRLNMGCAMSGNMALGATNSTADAKKAGQLMGSELASLGINTDLAPVVDVNNNANNSVIGIRSYSDSSSLVAKMASGEISGLHQSGVATCLKHFPGHGNTATDSHSGLPVVKTSAAQAKKVELYPYSKNASATDIVMTGHIAFPSLDSSTMKTKKGTIYTPASLSYKMIHSILRTQYHYNGVVMTDGMRMGALSTHFSELDAAIYAIKAGNDMILMPTDTSKMNSFVNSLISAAKKGRLPVSAINASVKRILKMKEKRGILSYNASKLTSANAAAVGSKSHHATENQIAKDGVTYLKNNGLPITNGSKVLLLAPGSSELSCMKLGIKRAQSQGYVKSIKVTGIIYKSMTSAIQQAIRNANIVICVSELPLGYHVSTAVSSESVPIAVNRYAKALGKKTMIISAGSPYDTAFYRNADALVAVYNSFGKDPTEALRTNTAYAPNIAAALEVMSTSKSAKGRLPVNVYQYANGLTNKILYKRGTGR
jgi:beta-N-acetylhexosaminidase